METRNENRNGPAGRAWRALALTAAAAFVLAGCGEGGDAGGGGGYGGGGASEPVETSESPIDDMEVAPVDGLELSTQETELGTVVTDEEGMTLYVFTNDTEGTETSACTGDCLTAWPIATAEGAEPAASDEITGTVGTIESPDGEQHLTLNGMPLYYFAQDEAPGDVTGQGVNDVWYAVSPDGEMVTE
ncbi:hypothetical protein [Zhihengliuella sp.]|uniref:COG4315 family predicted lipoprotein n=1 Tax=Zhihengliuella sp. TaxID=1954483 RepID=UPI0028112FD8|nr:hypothetical protein [Zhihengliuella sp.]